MTDQATDAAKDPLTELAELSAEHARLIEEKARAIEDGRTPSTRVNFELTKIVKRMVALAEAAHARGRDEGEHARTYLRDDAAAGGGASSDALELLADEDPWWGEGA